MRNGFLLFISHPVYRTLLEQCQLNKIVPWRGRILSLCHFVLSLLTEEMNLSYIKNELKWKCFYLPSPLVHSGSSFLFLDPSVLSCLFLSTYSRNICKKPGWTPNRKIYPSGKWKSRRYETRHQQLQCLCMWEVNEQKAIYTPASVQWEYSAEFLLPHWQVISCFALWNESHSRV